MRGGQPVPSPHVPAALIRTLRSTVDWVPASAGMTQLLVRTRGWNRHPRAGGDPGHLSARARTLRCAAIRQPAARAPARSGAQAGRLRGYATCRCSCMSACRCRPSCRPPSSCMFSFRPPTCILLVPRRAAHAPLSFHDAPPCSWARARPQRPATAPMPVFSNLPPSQSKPPCLRSYLSQFLAKTLDDRSHSGPRNFESACGNWQISISPAQQNCLHCMISETQFVHFVE
jgi:hypothetical protein